MTPGPEGRRPERPDPRADDPGLPTPESATDDGAQVNPAEETEARAAAETPDADEAVTAEAAEERTERAADAALFQDRWLRAEADLQNLRRRAVKEREETRRNTEESVLLDVITLLDDLERALEAARAQGAEASWLEGVELVASRMRDVLARRGVETMDPVGQPFDPTFHEAMLEVPAAEGQRPGDVAQVVLKGYRAGGRALRAARVVVVREPES